jgi:hypothetical protein
MNIDDVDKKIVVPDMGKILPAIFAHQRELMARYHEIEVKNGANNPPEPWNIDDRFVQWRIKDLFWRATEEIAEAHECRPKTMPADPMGVWFESIPVRHFFEELIDALHFLTEASIMATVLPIGDEWWNHEMDDIDARKKARKNDPHFRPDCVDTVGCNHMMAFNFISSLGLAANCLKNKQWKQTQILTDRSRFEAHMMIAWKDFFRMWHEYGMRLEDMYVIYIKKATVNEFRQGSNY